MKNHSFKNGDAMIEEGRAGMFTSPSGRTFRVEEVTDSFGMPSKKYAGCVYIWEGENLVAPDGHDKYDPIEYSAAVSWIEGLHE